MLVGRLIAAENDEACAVNEEFEFGNSLHTDISAAWLEFAQTGLLLVETDPWAQQEAEEMVLTLELKRAQLTAERQLEAMLVTEQDRYQRARA